MTYPEDHELEQHSSNGHERQYSDDKAIEAEQIETEPYETQKVESAGFLTKYKRHCTKWWWVHVIIFCVIFLIVALCLVYAAMPAIAQHGINESSLEVTEIEFLSPTSNSLVLNQKAIIHSPSMYTPTLDPFSAASYLVVNGTYATTPIIYIPMPRVHALHPQSSNEVDGAYVTFNDSASLQQVTDYATAVLTNEWVTTALVGKTKLHEGALPVITIKYNKTATYKGLNGLKGFNVTNAKINISATVGPNFSGMAVIPNPSNLTIALGNVTLVLATAKEGVIGNSTIENMTLVPGTNSLPMTAIINEVAVLQSLDPTLGAGMVELLITGNESVYNGQHLTYYEKALQSNALTLVMNVTQVLLDSA